MKAMIVVILMVWSLAVLACEKKDEKAESSAKSEPTEIASTPATSQPGSAHAPEGVKPGSYEDWCEEHKVPETMCTRCNPTLVAAFKATGDWCEEHGLPESQCLLCNPDLKIVRPAKVEEPKTNG